jgi:WD40 repeat protein
MTRNIRKVVWLIVASCTAFAAAAQAHARGTANKSPVAFVYVGSGEIYAFAAAADGRLTPVSGSPFAGKVYPTAVNSGYLFATDGTYIYSYSIASDGAIKLVFAIDAKQYNDPPGSGALSSLFLDRTGVTLYDQDIYCCEDNDAYQFFRVDNSTGGLTYLGVSDQATAFNVPMTFIGNSVYAYGASTDYFFHYFDTIYGFRRRKDGRLTLLGDVWELPLAPPGYGYEVYLTSADPTNHVAISVQAIDGNFHNYGLPQLATYTAHADGNLATTSTFWNMPTTANQYVSALAMSPSGKLLAVGGSNGLQVFHFNGGNPITHYTGLITKDEIDQVSWDNDDHLYAISTKSSKLFVFTVTPTSHHQAPGSPYAITTPWSISVVPKT